MATWNDPKYEGFPRPGPSFNPNKFKSMANYNRYKKAEEIGKETTTNNNQKKGQQVALSTSRKPVEKAEPVAQNVSIKTVKGEVKDRIVSRAAIFQVTEKAFEISHKYEEAKQHIIAPRNARAMENVSVTSEEECRAENEVVQKVERRDGFPMVGPAFGPHRLESLEATIKDADEHVEVGAVEMKKEPVTATATEEEAQDINDMNNSFTEHGKAQKPVLAVNATNVDRMQVSSQETCVAATACIQALKARDTEQDIDSTETLRLASIRRIKSMYETRIENRWYRLAEIDGWVCCVPNRSFKSGELILYLEIDSFILASDVRFGKQMPLSTFGGKLGHRVKSRRLGSGPDSVLVQGLVFPLEKFPDIHAELRIVREALERTEIDKRQVDTLLLALYRKENWAERLGILKWDEAKHAEFHKMDQQQQCLKVGRFPTHMFPKTSLSRLEDCPHLFTLDKYKKLEYQESVKMDGTSMTVYFVHQQSRLFGQLNAIPSTQEVGYHMQLGNGRFGVCSKNHELHELGKSNGEYWTTALRLDLPAKMARLGRNLAIQGELCGRDTNGGREQIPGDQAEFFVYSVYHMDVRKFMDPRKVVGMAQELGLRHVPVVGYVKIREIADDGEDLKKRARQRKGEGLVYKCLQDGRSFKVVSSTYLLEHNL